MGRDYGLVPLLLLVFVGVPAGKYAGAEDVPFADAAFQQRWAQTDAQPNGRTFVWGPGPFTGAVSEPYGGTTRTVQYFDKGRMELTNGALTAGLLAEELITGSEQDGDTTFTQRAPALLPAVGDASNSFPTYADLARLRSPERNDATSPITKRLNSDGSFTTYDTYGDPRATPGGFDDATAHRVPKALMDFRSDPRFGGIDAIGLAITEPVWVTVNVNGQVTDVLVQAFERRVLTYTPTNPDGFQVEYGNVGRAYFAWRYPNGIPFANPPSTPTTRGITLMDDGQTVNVKVGDRVVINLGGGYHWAVRIDDPTILVNLPNIPLVVGAQGVYEARRAGQTTLTATGDLPCRQSLVPCAAPSRSVRIVIVVT